MTENRNSHYSYRAIVQIATQLRFIIVLKIIRNCMTKILKRFTFLLIITIACAGCINAQKTQRFSISISAGMSKTGNLEFSELYRKSNFSSTVQILTTASSRNNNFNFRIGYQPIKSISINGSIGVASYGFQYTGNVFASPDNTLSVGGFVAHENYSTRLMEVGFSTSYQIANKNDFSFIFRPGIVWYTNPREKSRQILGFYMKSNNFSATLFTGIEVPIMNAFHVGIGLNAKIALQDFVRVFDFENKFRPYALGLETSLTYRF